MPEVCSRIVHGSETPATQPAIVKAAGAPSVTELWGRGLAILAVVGVIIATPVWARIGSRADGRRLLSVLVPAVLVLSFIPDVALGLSGTSPRR